MAGKAPTSHDHTTDELRSKFETLRGTYGTYHGNVEEGRRFYDLDFESDVLPAGARARGFRAVIPSTARRIIDEAVDHVLYMPKVKVPVRPTRSELITEQEIAEKKRKFVTAWWRQVTQRMNPLGDARKWAFLDGGVAVKQTLKMDLLPDKGSKSYRRDLEKLGRYDFLWDIELLDMSWVFADPADHRNPGYVFICYTLDVEQAKKKFPEGNGDWRGKQDLEKVNYLEYWSAPEFKSDGTWVFGRYCQWIDTENVHDDINPYPYIPIAVDDSGQGIVRESIEPEKKFVGMLHKTTSVLIAQARQWSAMEAVAELTAFNPIITRNMSAEKLAQLKVGPGEQWNLEGAANEPEAEMIEFATWPAIPITVPQVIQLIDREVNGTFKTDMLGGVPQTGVDTATEADQNVRNASSKLTGVVACLTRIATKMTRWALMDIELVIEAPVTMFGSGANDPADITLTPTEINGYYDCFLELRTTDEEALDLTRARFWGEMYRVIPFLSAWTAMEAGGIADDPLAEMIRRAGEDVFLSEEFRQIRVATGAASFGEFATYVMNMAQGNKAGEGGGMGGSDMGLVSQEGLNSPVESSVVTEALLARDVNQGGSQLRGGQ